MCIVSIMSAFCERPAIIITNTANCKKGHICCDNSRSALVSKPRPPPPQRRPPPPSPPPTQPTTTPIPDPRPDCPGSCLVSLLSFACVRKYFFFCLSKKLIHLFLFRKC